MKMKIDKEAEELKYCTFQPNVGRNTSPRNVKETIDKLYQDGVNKVKTKRNTENKEDEFEKESDDITFQPKINS